MTVINIVSGTVYLKKATARERTQVYGLAAVFLIILYDSPSGLVCYWILNNLFSLAKNVVNATARNPRRFVHALISAILLAAAVFLLFQTRYNFVKRLFALAAGIVVALLPLFAKIARKLRRTLPLDSAGTNSTTVARNSFAVFIFSAAGLALLAGLLLPSELIATSPAEFSFIGNTASPLVYIWSSLSFYVGFFVLWPLVIYRLFNGKVRAVMPPFMAALFILALLNAYVFKNDYGTMDVFCRLDNPAAVLHDYSAFMVLAPLFTFCALLAVALLVKRCSLQKYIAPALLIFCAAELASGIVKTANINKEYVRYAMDRNETVDDASTSDESKIEPIYHLSRDKQNVVVLFLDRAIPSFLPYIVREFPEMVEQFAGFTYYPNTVSYSTHTTKAAPAMIAGYEYTPENMNKRADELLRDKHNEALLVMPRLFLDAGWDVTITDPPFPNYTWKGDLSKYADYPEMHVSEIEGKYTRFYTAAHPDLTAKNPDYCVKGNMCSFVLLEMLPPFLRFTFHAGGDYYRTEIPALLSGVTMKTALDAWTSLFYLPNLSDAENETPAFIFIGNNTTHEYTLYENYTYLPSANLNENFATSGVYEPTYLPSSEYESDLAAYHVNAATLLQIVKWFDWLKAQDVYDNTRIIIVADHGRDISTPAFKNMKYGIEYAAFNPLFMVKDFDAHGTLKTDETFMTNADTIFFATKGLPVSDVNPFTKNKFSDFIKKDEAHLYATIEYSDFKERNVGDLQKIKTWILQDERRHTPSYIVHDDIFDEANWERIVK